MAIYLDAGSIILNGGAIAVSSACCCGGGESEPCDYCVDDIAPATVQIDVTGIDNGFAACGCDGHGANDCTAANGTYLLTFGGSELNADWNWCFDGGDDLEPNCYWLYNANSLNVCDNYYAGGIQWYLFLYFDGTNYWLVVVMDSVTGTGEYLMWRKDLGTSEVDCMTLFDDPGITLDEMCESIGDFNCCFNRASSITITLP